jgi:hypothetical protein
MVIEFLCPQGHKIRCGDDRAGNPAKCPKCGVKFYVPELEESEPSDSGSWATASAETSTTPGSGSSGSAAEQIEFLCPNGHRVWAPIALQGRAGQCPDCGSKFHIPTLADYEETPLDVVSSEDSVVNLEPLGGVPGGSSSKGSGLIPWPGKSQQQSHVGSDDRVARFLADLAADLPDEATLELLTVDGQTYVPDRVASQLCDAGRLAFSVKGDDDTHTLVVLPWPSIARIEIRGVKQVPLEFRE